MLPPALAMLDALPTAKIEYFQIHAQAAMLISIHAESGLKPTTIHIMVFKILATAELPANAGEEIQRLQHQLLTV
jgi:hypothetical protein